MNQQEFYKRALEITPWATQTYAKRPYPRTEDVMPLICKKAKGARFWDYEDKEYVDFFCSCGPIILGHHNEAVDERVKEEIDNGFLFSIASEREYELAKKLVDMFPAVDWVKFLKTGGDATSAAVRIARAYTGKEKIMQCGYHGWHDWYQCKTLGCGKEYGIPFGLSEYTIPFKYNDLESVENTLKNDDNIAGIIIVPYNWMEEPCENYLQNLRKLCDKYGVVLIFDEVKSGFRLDLLGAQGVYNVQPDLTCFAKAISNGYPLALVCGKSKYKDLFHKNTIITTTYAGETLSIAAAIKTIDEIIKNKAIESIYSLGNRLISGLIQISKDQGVEFEVRGRAPISTILFKTGNVDKDYEFSVKFSRMNFMKGMFVKIVGGPSYTLCYSHSMEDIDRALEVAEFAIKAIREGK